jgi:hypothetical protein
MDGNQDDQHVFQQQDIPTKFCTPDNIIYGPIATLVESCNLVNIHKLKHREAPDTHNNGSSQIDFAFLSYGAIELIPRCGVLDFSALFPSDHHTLFLDIDIVRILGYPVQCTVMSLERYLKFNYPRIIEVYQASLLQQLTNHNVASCIDSLYIFETSASLPSHKLKFNQIDRDVKHSMKCADNACRRKTYKKHKRTDKYTRCIYCIIYWRLRRNTLDNINATNDSAETLLFYATKYCFAMQDSRLITVDTCLCGIKSARSSIKVEIK